MMVRKFLGVSALALFLTACGSSVKLDNVPVEDRSGAAVGQSAGTSGDGSGVARSAVAPVELDRSSQAALSEANRTVYFDYDSFVIKPEFQSLIESQARFINADKSRRIAIEGHTDERGGREYNLALGQKRAEAVRRALGLLGVTEAQMEAVSFGKEKPAVQGNDEAAMAKNRRAEIVYR